MKSENRIVVFVCKNKSVRALLRGASLVLLVLGRTAEGQQEVMNPAPTPVTQTIEQQTEVNDFQVFAPEGATPLPSGNEPFQWGPVIARPHVLYNFLYGNGIQSSPGNQQDTVIQTISPGILFDIGTRWALDYTPTLRFYSDKRFKNEFDNSVTLTGRTAYEDWSFGILQGYTSSSAPIVQTGTQTDQQTYSTALTASHALNSKMSLDGGLYQSINLAGGLQNSRDWSTMEWLNYEFWPRFNIGAGAGLGYVNVDFGPDQTYEQLQGRANWRATDKLSFQANGGFEERQFLAAGTGNLFSPIFGASIQYQPFEVTQISLNASRSVSPSFFAGQDTENTSLSCDFNQRLLGKFNLDLNAAYNITKYVASANGVTANRIDDYYTLNARLSRPFLKRGTVAVFYQYDDNSSTATGFSYSGSQIGFEIGYSY